ncbi:transmembrane protein, putative [Bodo saltans]|uniref:Transmembrane protein, putative n=1 Tax=Bodo saltans TaxID=75058 RepID=A0A0S4J3E5_BODSA|nr:transmembrane protein, putative [Bodo saltans]|eukprot:CUG31617.1 transmembrane protein, putative [Bodo saltans]
MIAIAVLCSSVEATKVFRSPYSARLVAGKENRDVFGDLLNYYIFAEAGAVVTPAPQWEIFLRGQKQTITEALPAKVASSHREKIKANGDTATISQTLTVEESNSDTKHFARKSYLSFTTISHPAGSAPVRGTTHLASNSDSRFVLSDWLFPLPGRYNMMMNATMYWGAQARFNVTVNVDHQPGRIVMTQYPVGYNGSAMTTEPQAQLEDLLGNPSRSDTCIVTFTVLTGPTGYLVQGTASTYPDDTGKVQLPNVILSQPGLYVVYLLAALTDGTTIRTSTFSFTVARALPTSIVIIQQATGVTRAVFFTSPIYRIRDQIGFSQDTRVNITLALGLNSPSVTYKGEDTIAVLEGVNSRTQTGFDFVFPALSINLPGNFEIVATLYLDGESFLQITFGLVVADLPTFNLPAPLEVNTVGVLTLYGSQPLIQPLYIKMSNEIGCTTSASDVATWPKESSTVITTRNVSFVPFSSGTNKYLCIGVPTQAAYIPLLLLYEPAFNEPYPLAYTFDITGVSTCQDLSNTDEYLYRTAGWTTATAGRAYGCFLTPPVSGTIAPCDCFFILSCTSFSDQSFTPPGLDIGMCVCCKGWVLVAACVSTAAFFALMMYVIYVFV